MAKQRTYDICRTDLFTSVDELTQRYGATAAMRVARVRQGYLSLIDTPAKSDREIVMEIISAHKVSESCAYSDLQLVKKLLPSMDTARRDFHRWRANEMLLDTFRLAKTKGNLAAMERAAASYAKYNRVDCPEEERVPYEEIVVQPFMATDDPRVLGIEPIPNLQNRIREMIQMYSKDFADIEDVQFEESDLDETGLFGESKPEDATFEEL